MAKLPASALSSLTPAEREYERRTASDLVRALTDSRLAGSLKLVTDLMTEFEGCHPSVQAKWALRVEAIVTEIARRSNQGPVASALRKLGHKLHNRDTGAFEKLGSAKASGRPA